MEKINILPGKIKKEVSPCIQTKGVRISWLHRSGCSRLGFALLIFILVSQGIRTYATNIEITDRKYLYTMDSGIPSTYTTSVIDPSFTDIYNNTAAFKDKKATGYLQLGIDNDVLYCHSEFIRVEVLFAVTTTVVNSWTCGNNGSTDTTTTTEMRTLTISFDPAAQQIYTEKARILFPNAYSVKAVVASVTMYDATNTIVFSGTGYNSLPQDLYWESGVQLERYQNFVYSSSPANFEVTVDNTTHEIVFTWTQKTGAVFYEIEFTHAHDYSLSAYSTPLATTQINTTFNNNGTRVRLLEGITEYRIPNIFDRGYVLARIRGIGMAVSGAVNCNMDNEIPGYWSFEENPTAPFLLSTMNTDHYEPVNSHEGFSGNNKNWKMSGSYAEDGKHKEVVEYADGSSRVRQSVTKLSTTEEVIIGETMYDYQGRPTVQILPVPVDGDKVINYHANFNLEDASLDKFSREHFDDDAVFSGSSCIPTAPMLSTTIGASYYYSSANTNTAAQQAFVADAFKYPYTQVVYTPDNTGRIKMQSGVGDAHILGSGHETKYFYGKPFQEELDRLFGTNVGYKSHYQKNMVIDANGQVSISFLDMSGKTIATALAGEPAPNLTALTNDVGVDLWESVAETLEVNLLGDVTPTYPNGEDNHLSANGLVWSNTIPLLVEATGTYRFTYEAELRDYLDSCLESACFDCVYDLKINLLNSCNEPEPGFPVSIHLGADMLDTLCNDTNIFTLRDSSNNAYMDAILQVGNYTVVKTLTLDEDAIGYYTDKYIENNTCLKTWDDFYQMPDTSGCYYSCEDCLAELGDTTSFYAANPGIRIEQLRILYRTKQAVCEAMCAKNNNDLCLTGYKSMLRDMTPRGQYAVYDIDANGDATIPEDKLSIFHNDPFLPDHTNLTVTSVAGPPAHDQIFSPQTDPWRHPHYFDKDDPNSYIPTPSYADPANAFYFDENGEKSRIYLDQDINGDWVPAVILDANIMTDTSGSYVYPHELLYMEDFISRFNANDAWAKSLLVYHPEFLYMKECVHVNTYDVNLNIGGAGAQDYDTWAFNEALLTMDYGDAGDIMPTTVGSLFDLREKDPFFINFGTNNVLGGFLVNDLYDYKANAYADFPAIPATLNIHQVAYGTVNCIPTSPAFPTGCSIPSTNALCITGPEEWDRLVGSYISIKTEVLLRYLHMKLFNDYFLTNNQFYTNQCIGAVDYDTEARPHTLDPWMPCDLVEYFRYAEKQVRFGLPESIYNNGAFDPSPPTADQLMAYGQQQVYQSTGLCPAAIDLQSLMYGLKHSGDFVTAGLPLTDNNYLGLVLRDKIEADNAGIVPSYTGSISGQVYTGVTGTNSFTLTLPGGYNWADVQMIGNIDDVFLSLGDYTFTLQAQVLNTTTGEMDWVGLTGFTNLQIGNCKPEIPKICKATPEAKDLKVLIDALKTDGVHDNTGVDLSPYNDLISPALTGYLGAGSPSDYEWNYNTGTDIGQLLNTSTGKYITMNITAGAADFEGTSFEIFNISGSMGTSPTVTTDNGFVINGYTSMGWYYIGLPTDISFSGTISWYNGSSTNDFAVTDCQDPLPMDCQTIPHQNFNELLDYIENGTALSNPCIKPVGPNFPANYTLISLHADMEFSTDVITTDHFVAIILADGETENDTVRGTYCKNIRECLDCDTTEPGPDPGCDELYFTIDFGNYAITKSMTRKSTYTFDLPAALADCYDAFDSVLTFNAPIELSGPFTLQDVIDAWIIKINAGGGGNITAQAGTGVQPLQITLHNLAELGCVCTDEDSAAFTMSVPEEDVFYFTDQIDEVCCTDSTEIPCDGLYFTVDLNDVNILPEPLATALLTFIPPNDLLLCYIDYMAVMGFDVQAELGGGPYTIDHVLEAWANKINTGSSGYFSASYIPGSEIITIYLHHLDETSCVCNRELRAELSIYKTIPGLEEIYSKLVHETCCEEPPLARYNFAPQFFVNEPDTSDTNSTWEPHIPITLGSPCDMNLTPFPPPPPVPNDCVQSLLAAAQLNADNAYEDYLDSVKAAFRAAYIHTCMNVTEDFRATFTNEQYHFTLYYYDQAGNLAKTVPPKAVTTIANANLNLVTTARNTNSTYLAGHDKIGPTKYREMLTTKYQYNSLGQPRYQETPDGGTTVFMYDALGRIAISQNAKQEANTNTICSVTKYDKLGRILMVGEMNSTTPLITQDNTLTASNLDAFIATSAHIYQVTYTVYDESYNSFPQDNLRNRVSAVYYMDDSEDTERSILYYSYDIHGNVKTYWQENRDVPDVNHQVKRMDYMYDLVSGKVNKVIYQEGARDQWIHQYEYDADNRITKVETSRDNVFYDRDAAYFYYKHGPLARTELGELNVQGIDYAYTIHGWLKAVNSTHLNTKTDMGKDGDHTSPGPHRYYAKDAFSYALHYYDGDYQNITANPDPVADVSSLSYSSLYNGNIAMMQTSLYDISSTPTKALLLSKYDYDQLNRIKLALYNADYDNSMNVWNNTFDDRYGNEFKYDPNGNITFQARNGEISNPDMDKLTYEYLPGTNKLGWVRDAYTSTYTDDIDDQPINNYGYDKIGNLVKDSIEEIETIDWTVYGKVRSVTRYNGSTKQDLEFSYGPSGQRITKKSVEHGNSEYKGTYYFHDATGNIIGIYMYDKAQGQLYLEEQVMYGNSRLGSISLHEKTDSIISDSNLYVQKRGEKRYELSNHLGNVLVTISDRRTLDCGNNVYIPDIITSTDYSPFGAPLAGRTWTKVGEENYRFGFNGQEKDNEIYGKDNAYSFEYRIHDPRLGRFLSVDPLTKSYPELTPYQFASNIVISCVELEGKEARIAVYGAGIHVDENTGQVTETDHLSQFRREANKDVEQKHSTSAFAVHNHDLLINTLKNATKQYGSIEYLHIFSHSSNVSIILDNGQFSRSLLTNNKQASDVEITKLEDIFENDEIKFAENALIIMGGCNAATQYYKGQYVGSIAKNITKRYNYATIGAVGKSAPTSEGRKATKFVLFYKDENNQVQEKDLGKVLTNEKILEAQEFINDLTLKKRQITPVNPIELVPAEPIKTSE